MVRTGWALLAVFGTSQELLTVIAGSGSVPPGLKHEHLQRVTAASAALPGAAAGTGSCMMTDESSGECRHKTGEKRCFGNTLVIAGQLLALFTTS